jgi:cytochrome c oxidase assembly protein subunit 15
MQSPTAFVRALQKCAPTLTKRFFSGRPCTKSTTLWKSCKPIRSSTNITSSRINTFKHAFRIQKKHSSTVSLSHAEALSMGTATKAKTSSFPDTSSNTVGYWLLGSAASVFGIVIFGGLTRLTESGLSITEWKPVTGSLPPMSDADWTSEFLKYQSSPEFHLLNPHMSLQEFKNIYWMEWIHRLWGRVIGITFVVPAIYFITRRKASKPMMARIAGIAGLIGFQGFLGWWMVKSGLKDDLFAPGSHPRVSQYRLTAHLGAAFLCYSAMLWNGLSILRTNKLLSMPPNIAQNTIAALQNPSLRLFKRSTALLTLLVFTTALSGGLVAGLDAGLIYNEFPYMGLGFAPPKKELFDPFYSKEPAPHNDLVWRNMTSNPSLVQLDHRILATTTFLAVQALFAYARFAPAMKAHLPKAAMKGVHGVMGLAWLQITLGISTLIYMVPLPLASAHQAGALALLSYSLVLLNRIRVPRRVAQMVAKRAGLGAVPESVSAANSTRTMYPKVVRSSNVVQPGMAHQAV